MDQIQNGIVHLLIFILIILKYVLQLHGVSQFIVSQKVPVAVIDISPCTGKLLGLLDGQQKVVLVFLTVDDLKIKAPIDQDCGQACKYHCKKR